MSEKIEFSKRLRQAMQDAGYAASPSVLEHEFNLRWWGRSISTQAAWSWLNSKAIPAQDKMQVLADWLKVEPEVLRFADLTLDTGTHRAQRGDRFIDLTAKEYELLELFMRNPRRVLTREMIFDRVWGYDFGGESNVLDVYIRYLRQKLENEGESRLLHTVRGVGYVLRDTP